jgi:TP901 family phage tail tape measure protein
MADVKKRVVINIVGDDSKFRKTMSGIGGIAKTAAVAATAAFGAVTTATIKTVNAFSRFESQFTTVVTLLDESSFKTKTLTQGINDLKSGVLKLRSETGESFENLNKGLFDLISAGIDASEAIDTLRTATKLARAGATNTSIAVDGLTSVIKAYGLNASEAESISQKFFTAQKFGKTTIEELSTGFGDVASNAKSLGVSFEEVVSAVSAATLGAVETNKAYTGLRAVFANIIRPTKEARDEAKRLGIEFNSTSLRSKGLNKFLKDITESANFNSTSLEKLFSSVEATTTIMALAGEQSGDFDRILGELNDETKLATNFNKALAEQSGNVKQKFDEIRGVVETLIVRIGEKLAPAVGKLADEFQGYLDTVTDDELQRIADGMSAIFDVVIAIAKAINTVVQGFGKLAEYGRSVGKRKANFETWASSGSSMGFFEWQEAQRKQEQQTEPTVVGNGGRSFPIEGGFSTEKNQSMPEDAEDDPVSTGVAKIQSGLPANEEEYDAVKEEKAKQDEELANQEKEKRERELKAEREHRERMNKLLSTSLQDKIDILNDANATEQQKSQAQYAILEQLGKAYGGKLLALNKILTIKNSILNIQEGITEALSLPFPANLAAAATVAAQGAGVLATARNVSDTISGAAQGTIVGGTDTGQDNRMMAVRSGEMILPPDLAVSAAPTIRDIIRNEDQIGNPQSATSSNRVQVEFVGDAGRLLREIDRETNYVQGL